MKCEKERKSVNEERNGIESVEKETSSSKNEQ